MKPYDFVVIHDKFRFIHQHTIDNIVQCQEITDNIIILIDACNRSRSIVNPFTAEERKKMIITELPPAILNNVYFVNISDRLYNPEMYYNQFHTAIDNVISVVSDYNGMTYPPNQIGIITSNQSKQHLSKLSRYEIIKHIPSNCTNSLTEGWLSGRTDYIIPLPSRINQFLEEFKSTIAYKYLQEEYTKYVEYKNSWKSTPYPPFFVTADAVVIKNNHVLMVTRKNSPGKNLLALPGGFVNQDELIVDAAMRELWEETQIDVPDHVLRNSIKREKVYDHPDRSIRGRTITTAFLIDLSGKDTTFPIVQANDDAVDVDWISLYDLRNSCHTCFEDHADIIFDIIDY
ncbi:MAG: NUDIX domain-containing protein [Nitrososphaeraceae archaeon]